MAYYSFKNNLKATLYYDMLSTDTTIRLTQLVSSSDAPTRLAAWPTCDANNIFTLTLTDTVTGTVEVINCTSVTANDAAFMTFACTRAQEGTTALAHTVPHTTVENRCTAAALNVLPTFIASILTKNTDQDMRLTTVETTVTTLSTTVTGKANVAMDNLTTAGKNIISRNATPASGFVALSFPWGGGNLATGVPEDGWLQFSASGSNVDTYIWIDNAGIGASCRALTGTVPAVVTVPCRKGDKPYIAASPWGAQTFALNFVRRQGVV